MTKPSLRSKTFNELVELASIGGAFMALANKYADLVEPTKRRKRRRKKVLAEAGDGTDSVALSTIETLPTTRNTKVTAKDAKTKTSAKRSTVPKPQGNRKIPRKDIPVLGTNEQ